MSTPNRHRFVPPSAHRSYIDQGSSDKETYSCPRCHASLLKFQLRNDKYGTPRSVDVTGMPCEHCQHMLMVGADVDDWK